MTNFVLIFATFLGLNVAVTFRSCCCCTKNKKEKPGEAKESSFSANAEHYEEQWQNLLRRYLLIYLLAAVSDWLQGPYVPPSPAIVPV